MLGVEIRVVASDVEHVFKEISVRSRSLSKYIVRERGFRQAMFTYIAGQMQPDHCPIAIVLSPMGRDLMHALRIEGNVSSVIFAWENRN